MTINTYMPIMTNGISFRFPLFTTIATIGENKKTIAICITTFVAKLLT